MESQTLGHYGGIPRFPYFCSIFGLACTTHVLRFLWSSPSGRATLIVSLLFMLLLITVFQRLKNIGIHPGWCLLMLVPIANLLVVIGCLLFQEGYADTKKLDIAGKIIALTLLVLVLIAVVYISVFVLAMAS